MNVVLQGIPNKRSLINDYQFQILNGESCFLLLIYPARLKTSVSVHIDAEYRYSIMVSPYPITPTCMCQLMFRTSSDEKKFPNCFPTMCVVLCQQRYTTLKVQKSVSLASCNANKS